MEIYTSDTSYIIRHDFMRFSADSGRGMARINKVKTEQEIVDASLQRLRRKMTEDDGRSSLGTYKCPIF